MTSTFWYTTTDFISADASVPRLVYFFGTVRYSGNGPFPARISADGRYKLYVNDAFVQAGPLKGDDQVHYYDETDLTGYLHAGENTVTVILLNYPADRHYGNHSIFRSGTPRMYFRLPEDAQEIRWRTFTDRSVSIVPEEEGFAPLCIHETHSAKSEDPADSRQLLTSPAIPVPAGELPRHLLPENLLPRDIPFAVKIPHEFSLPFREIPAGTEKTFVLDAGEEMCAYLSLAMSGGKGAQVELLYAECYTGDGCRTHRTDSVNGHLKGYTDRYEVNGAENERFEPFWFRTFRFIRVSVRTAEEPLKLGPFSYTETGYPLSVRTQLPETSDRSLTSVWDISLRTLRRCMHDTYMDCPFYEQLCYTMDTRSEILYTYAVSGDDRLARRAILDFARAGHPSGLLNCSYPNVNENIIPGFSLYYILMVHDHMMYFGDRELIRKVLPTIERILSYFEENVQADGLVGKVGGINGKGPQWSFIDWSAPWMETTGMPSAGLFGPLTIESLLLIMALQAASELMEYVGDTDRSRTYRVKADEIRKSVRRECMNADGMITDGPGRPELSQHCQVFGILSGVLSAEEGKRNLLKADADPEAAKCSVAMMFYLFRALEKTGLYDQTDRYWNLWRKMVEDGCTTSIEGENYARSECHAWGA
ncbi:MAG: family 78 glycoside hydrolase catalytic domain, partial [Lachnospiraceae bacterium]|nr:family 78 glycoside hydrolase catalytic domain [Lachnospiraceae bacterium]